MIGGAGKDTFVSAHGGSADAGADLQPAVCSSGRIDLQALVNINTFA
jgi:hypothetical protein